MFGSCCKLRFLHQGWFLHHRGLETEWPSSPGGCFTNISQALQSNLTKICNAIIYIYVENFKLKLCTHKLSSWNSHKKYNFCNTQISREYFQELVKCLWNNPLGPRCVTKESGADCQLVEPDVGLVICWADVRSIKHSVGMSHLISRFQSFYHFYLCKITGDKITNLDMLRNFQCDHTSESS